LATEPPIVVVQRYIISSPSMLDKRGHNSESMSDDMKCTKSERSVHSLFTSIATAARPLLARPKRVAYVAANYSALSPNWLGAYH